MEKSEEKIRVLQEEIHDAKLKNHPPRGGVGDAAGLSPAPYSDPFDAICFEDWSLYALVSKEFGVEPHPELFIRPNRSSP